MRPSAEELAAFGAQPEDVAGDLEVWFENADAVAVFAKVRTQWRHGFNGITGLIYDEVWRMIRRLRVPLERRDEVFADVQVMERAVLEMAKEKSDG